MARKQRRRNGRAAHSSLQTLQDDIAALQANMSKVIADLGGAASEGVTQAMRNASTTAEEVAEQVEEFGSESVDTVRSTIRAQPLVACAISVGAGALLGALISSSARH
jgi:ElaB/YqjD/DUF883 family membrane-anchored ribosome-binding protein